MTLLCSCCPKSGKIRNSVCKSKMGFFSVVSDPEYLLEVELLFKKGWQGFTLDFLHYLTVLGKER